MSNTICICCSGRMTMPSPRNPNICPGCEQLLEDDCAALDKLMPEVQAAEPVENIWLTAERRDSVLH